jgi:hypothetical protein
VVGLARHIDRSFFESNLRFRRKITRVRAIPSTGKYDDDDDVFFVAVVVVVRGKERGERFLGLGIRVVASATQRASEPWRAPQAEVEEEVGEKERRAQEGTRVKKGDR